MKRLLMLITIVTFYLHNSAQTPNTIFSGTVADSEGIPLNGITCRIMSASDSVLAYTYTKEGGKYLLETTPEAAFLEFSSIQYETKYIKIESDKTIYDVELAKKSIELKEVIVKGETVRRSRDTLFYSVEAFRQKEDRYIEDVLKRLPGIEITDEGTIIYMGKNINSFNIEGHNLMGNGYAKATKNMPAEAVAQIQVMENNQPVRALQDKIRNNNATINVKLKREYKTSPFGEAEAGGGISRKLWDNKLTTIQVSKKNQFLINGAMNNRGLDFSSLINKQLNGINPYINEPLPASFISAGAYRTPPMSSLYYLKNKSEFLTINYLHAFTEYSTLKTNFSMLNDKNYHTDSIYEKYTSEESIEIFETNNVDTKCRIMNADLCYELNSKNLFLKDELSGNINKSSSTNINTSNNNKENTINEIIKNSPKYLQNTIDAHLNTAQRIYSLSSIWRIYTAKDNIFLNNNTAKEAISLNNLLFRNRIATSFDILGNAFTLAHIIEYKRNSVKNMVEKDSKDKSNYLINTIETNGEIKIKRGYISINIPLEYISYKYGWRTDNNNKLMVSPQINANYQAGKNINYEISAGQNRNFNTSEVLCRELIMRNHRSFYIPSDSAYAEKRTYMNMKMSYINSATLLSYNLFAEYLVKKNDLLTAYLYTPYTSLNYSERIKNKSKSVSLAASIQKIFRNIGFNINHKSTFSHKKTAALQNEIKDFLNINVYSGNLNINWNKWKLIHIDFMSELNLSWKGHDKFSENHNFLKNMYYTLRTDLFPSNNIQMYIDFSHTMFEIRHGVYSSNFFLNSGVKYILFKNMSVSINAINLINRKKYEESYYFNSNYSYFNMPLRGREIILNVNIKI